MIHGEKCIKNESGCVILISRRGTLSKILNIIEIVIEDRFYCHCHHDDINIADKLSSIASLKV